VGIHQPNVLVARVAGGLLKRLGSGIVVCAPKQDRVDGEHTDDALYESRARYYFDGDIRAKAS
jgi:hypothetical protein